MNELLQKLRQPHCLSEAEMITEMRLAAKEIERLRVEVEELRDELYERGAEAAATP
jgi:hypothetical protein